MTVVNIIAQLPVSNNIAHLPVQALVGSGLPGMMMPTMHA